MPGSYSPLLSVLAHYPPDCAPRAWTKATSGFSGAEVYRLETPRGTLALRRWPAEHPSPERLTWIHTVLTQAVANGFDRLPLPIPIVVAFESNGVPLLRRSSAGNSCGDTFVLHDGHLWELAPWLPGDADFHRNPNPARLTAAMQALAQLHLAMANVQPNSPLQDTVRFGPSPGLAARLTQLRGLLSGGAAAIRSAVAGVPDPGESASTPASLRPATEFRATVGLPSSALLDAAQEVLTHFERLVPDLERQLGANVDRPVPLQPTLRDIHDEHVLFVGDQVTGIIDFGAMRFETVAGDIARLLGSLVTNDPAGWQAGLSAYESLRPLSDTERELVPLFDRSGLLLGGMNWLEWLFVARRQFADLARVRARLDAILARLRV